MKLVTRKDGALLEGGFGTWDTGHIFIEGEIVPLDSCKHIGLEKNAQVRETTRDQLGCL